jgi:AAA family ATP:ADP antiporter
MQTTQLTKIEKVLRLFTEVKAGEGTTVLLMFSNVFLILCAYYFIKPLREGWVAISDIEGLSKMEVKAYSNCIQSLLLLFFIGWYGRLAKRTNRVTLMTRATLFCILNMLIFWLLQPGFFVEKLPLSGIVFYLWVGMFGVFVVAQFWTFSADIYTDEMGKRLLPLIAIGGTAGAAAGSWIVNFVISHNLVSTNYLLLIATVPLLISICLLNIVERRQGKLDELVSDNMHFKSDRSIHSLYPKGEDGESNLETFGTINNIENSAAKIKIGSVKNGVRLIFISKFVLLAALVTLLTNWVNTNGENLLFRVIQDTLANQAIEQGISSSQNIQDYTRKGTIAFYGDFFFWVNITALFLQSFVASRLLKFGGFGVILLLLPVIALISYSMMALLPILAVVKIMKIAENATDYSINNTARHVLWLPMDSMMKFLGKPAIDTFYVRLGDGFAAITVLIGVQILALSIEQFFVFNVSLVILWLICGVMLVKEYNKVLLTNSVTGCD